MFHAGDVLPSSPFLLQLLTPPGGDRGWPLDVCEVSEPPVRVATSALSADGRASGLKVLEPLVLLAVLGPLLRVYPGDASEGLLGTPPPVEEGLRAPGAARLGPMAVGNLSGLWALATRLKALRHWRTWAGSLASYRSTVRKRSWAGMLSGGCSQARRKCEMFSIWIKGMDDFLNLTGLGMAMLTSLLMSATQTRRGGCFGGARSPA